MVQEQMPHKVTMQERKNLTMTGVTEVVSFDDTTVILKTSLGTLIVQGRDLQLKQLSQDGGQVAVDGMVSALSYAQARESGGFLRRLLG